MKRKNFLTCKNVIYKSIFDKEGFFEWLNSIKSILEIEKQNDTLYLYFKSKRIPDKDFRSLIGLFDRFKINMKQLQLFLNERNKKWVYEGEDKGYWFNRMFDENIPEDNNESFNF